MRHTDAQRAETLAHEIRAERDEDPTRRSSLDRDGCRARKQTLLDRIAAAAPKLRTLDEDGVPREDASLKPRLNAFGIVIAASLARVDSLSETHPQTTLAQQRYNPEAHSLSGQVFKKFTTVRGKIDRRLGNGEVDRAIKDGCSVGVTVNPESPMDVRDRTVLMLSTLENPKYAPRLKDRGIELPPLVNPLKPLLAKLRAAIDRGPGSGLTRGESTDEINSELLFLDIALARAISFLEDHDAEEDAAALNDLIPRRYARRAGDRKGEAGTKAEGGTKADKPGEQNAPKAEIADRSGTQAK